MTIGIWLTPKKLEELLAKYKEAETLISTLISESAKLKKSSEQAKSSCQEIEYMLKRISILQRTPPRTNVFGDITKRKAAVKLFEINEKNYMELIQMEDCVRQILSAAQSLLKHIEENREIKYACEN